MTCGTFSPIYNWCNPTRALAATRIPPKMKDTQRLLGMATASVNRIAFHWNGNGDGKDARWPTQKMQTDSGRHSIKCLQHLMRKGNVGRSTARINAFELLVLRGFFDRGPFELSCSVNKLRHASGTLLSSINIVRRVPLFQVIVRRWFVSCKPLAMSDFLRRIFPGIRIISSVKYDQVNGIAWIHKYKREK